MATINDLPLIAGAASTVIFAASYLPMLVKAARTKDLSSYSRTQLVLTNLANVLYSAYVFTLPPGPIWALHSFYLVTSAVMLTWSIRYRRRVAAPKGSATSAVVPAASLSPRRIGIGSARSWAANGSWGTGRRRRGRAALSSRRLPSPSGQPAPSRG